MCVVNIKHDIGDSQNTTKYLLLLVYKITTTTTKHKIVNYHCYVDDVLVIFDSNHTSIQTITGDFNVDTLD